MGLYTDVVSTQGLLRGWNWLPGGAATYIHGACDVTDHALLPELPLTTTTLEHFALDPYAANWYRSAPVGRIGNPHTKKQS